MAYTIGPVGGLGRIPKEQFDPFAHLPENQYYLPPQTGLRTLSAEQFPGGGSFTEVSSQPDAGLERGLAEYRAKGGIKPRSEYEQAYAQALGEIRPSEGNLMPSSYQEAQTEIQRMIKIGRAKGYADNDIIADIRERGLDKIQPVQPKYQEVSKGAGLYQLGPEGAKEIVPRGLEEPKKEQLPSKIEEFEMLYPEMKGKRGTEEYKKAYMNVSARGQQGDFRNESSMRKEFLTLPEVKDYPTVQQQSQRALAALKASGGNMVAVDQSIITTFNKMLDPTSVVRESEYARTPQDMALLNRIKGKWDKLSTGGAGLTSEEREAMTRMVGAFKDIADNQYNQQVDYYSGLAERYGYQPENVVRLGGKKTEAQPTTTATGSPKIGTVEGGYKFKGGDPSNPASWEKL